MEIQFCDVCNESVPESDIAIGKAVRRGDRVVCAQCETAMSGEDDGSAVAKSSGSSGAASAAGQGAPGGSVPPSVPSAGSRRGSGVWVALVALLFSAGAAAFLGREFQLARDEAQLERAGMESELRGLERSRRELLAAMERQSDQLGERLDEGLGAVQRELELGIAGLRRDLDAGLSRVGGAEESLADMRGENEAQVLTLGERLDEITAQLLRAREDASFYGDRLAAIEQVVQNGGGRQIVPQPAGEAPGDAGPTWLPLVADLSGDDAGIRWNAVDGLGETGDLGVVPHLVPVLTDEDVFVRMAVARVLGDLGSPLAIEPLIGALEDEEAVVRETAMLSLRGISGRNFKFDAVASPAERGKKVKAWRKWWLKAKEDFLGAKGQP